MLSIQLLMLFAAVASIFECSSNFRRLKILWIFKHSIKKPCAQLRKHFKLDLAEYRIPDKKWHKILGWLSALVILVGVLSVGMFLFTILTVSPLSIFTTPPILKTLCYVNIGFYALGCYLRSVIDCDVMNMNYNQNQVTTFIAENTVTITLESSKN